MSNLDALVVELKERVQAVRASLQQARLDLEALDRRVNELAKRELHEGC